MPSLGQKTFHISYDRELARYLNNKTAAALISKLSYWFTKYEHGFYKFMEPCSHKLYRLGDSWCEEFSLTRRTITKAFDLIGVRYRSKRLFLEAEDPFQGKLFASYIDNDTNQTFYLKNPQGFSQIIENMRPRLNDEKGEKKYRCAAVKSTVPIKDNKKDFKKKYPPKSPIGSFYFKKEKLEERLKKDFIKKEKTHDEACQVSFSGKKEIKQSSYNFQKAEKILGIWQEETGGRVRVPTLTTHFAGKILKAVEKHFDGCVDKWRYFSKLCASSKWLMGEAKSDFKAWLIWILKDKVITAIKNYCYGVNRSLPLIPPQKTSFEDILRKIDRDYQGIEKSKRRALLEHFGPSRYQREFASMTLTALKDGRFFLRFKIPWDVHGTSSDKKALLEIFQSASIDCVPSHLSILTYITRWKLEDSTHYPYLFIAS